MKYQLIRQNGKWHCRHGDGLRQVVIAGSAGDALATAKRLDLMHRATGNPVDSVGSADRREK
jgi:hypothetical protein